MAQFTKQMLSDSLKELMKTKSLDKITVTELVDTCGVNRQTFYYHFQDIYDLLGWIFRMETVEVFSNLSFKTWQDELRFVIDYIDANQEFCINTCRSLGQEHLESFLYDVFQQLLQQIMADIAGVEQLPEEDRIFIIRFYSFALGGEVLAWIRDGFVPESDVLLRQIVNIMDGGLVRAVENGMDKTTDGI